MHSDLAHLRALVCAAAEAGVDRQLVHCFTDGRDTPPDSGLRYVGDMQDATRSLLEEVRDGDVVLTLGAGNVWPAGEALLERRREADGS